MIVGNFGMVALLLLRLDARMGTWEPAASLAQHFNVTEGYVCDTLEQLAADELVMVQRHQISGQITQAMVPAP